MNPALANVTVISVTYQSRSIVDAMATTLRRFQNVIAIDNASQDGTAAALVDRIPHARVIPNTENVGFGRGNNQALALTRTPYALLLNPDCDITLEAVQTLVATMERYPNAAIVAPQSWRAGGKPQMSYRQAFFERRPKQAYRIPDGTCSAKWLHGCCLLVRVDAVRSFGGFDARFFLYHEDDDLCLQALRSGHECLVEPAAHVMHMGDASSTPSLRINFRKYFHFSRSRHLLIEKYLGKQEATLYLLKIMVTAPLAVLLYLLLFQRKHALKWLAWGCSAWANGIRSFAKLLA